MENILIERKPHYTSILKQSKGTDEKLLADIVHKIKNRLGGIGGFAALLERDMGAKEDLRLRYVQRIQDGVKGVNDVVISLMTLVRQVKPNPEDVKLRPLLDEMWENSQGNELRHDKKVIVHPHFSNGKVIISADYNMMRDMIHHALQFIELIGCKLDCIQVNPSDDNDVAVEFHFINSSSINIFRDNFNLCLENYEPVEARLALAIVLKIVDCHDGHVTIEALSDKQCILTIQV